MSHIAFALSALFLLFQPLKKITPIKEAISLVPRNSITESTKRFVSVTGIVTVPSARTDGALDTYIQGRHSGISLFEYHYTGPPLLVGDSIVATGKLGLYYGQEEIDSPRITLIKRGLKVHPITATVKQVRDGTFHGMLVRCRGRIIRKKVGADGVTIYFVGSRNDTASAYADYRIDPQFEASSLPIGVLATITGVSSRFTFTKPFTGHNDILIRSSADISIAPVSFLDRYSGTIEFIFVIVFVVAVLLGTFTYILRVKVRQKTSQIEEQTRVLRLFFDGIAELTGVLDRNEILLLALKRGQSLIGTRCVIFAEAQPADDALLLTAFRITDGRLSEENKEFGKDSFARFFFELSRTDTIWNTTADRLTIGGTAVSDNRPLLDFLTAHFGESKLTVTSIGKDSLAFFDHTGPISRLFPKALVNSYILHVYSAYRSAKLFDLTKEQGTALEKLYNNSVFGLMTFSEECRILTANRVAMQMFDSAEMVGKKVAEFLTPESAERFNDLLTSLTSASREKFVRFVAQIRTGSGRGDVEFAVQFDADSKVFYTTVQDTGDREYYESYAAKENKIATLEKLASSLTHDLNNIVGSITGYASLLKRKLPQDSKEHHYADIIETSSRKTTELVKEVLGFAQLDTKTLEVVDLNRFVAEITMEFRKTHGEKYSILLTRFERPVHTRISTSQIRQVILAVLTNAAESMENGGTIMCTVGAGEVPHPAPIYVSSGEHCFVEIEDHGIGMDDAIKKRIFEPFFTTKRVKKYTGLSLSMAYNIVKHHKGYIGVESAAGTGTRVKIYLPRHLEKVRTTVETHAPDKANASGTKILVVDDEEGVRQLAHDILVERGYSVVTANDGLQALELLSQETDVKLVVLDMVMPGMGGKDTCIEIKRRPNPPKVLICTGYSELSDLESILGKHADGLLQKPYSTSEMASTVDQILAL